MKGIIKKWYDTLGFDAACDKRLEFWLDRTDLSDLTDYAAFAPTAKDNPPAKNLLACLWFCEALEREYAEMGIPRAVLLDSLQDLVLWNASYFGIHGDIGLTEFPWIDRTFQKTIFRLGRLQFEMKQLKREIEPLQIAAGTNMLAVHIPRGGALTSEACQDSFARADAFFARYFPKFTYEYACCNSWMLDETLLPLLGDGSNVAKFQSLFLPVRKIESDSVISFTFRWDAGRHNIAEFEPRSRFAARVKERALAGEPFYMVLGIRKIK